MKGNYIVPSSEVCEHDYLLGHCNQCTIDKLRGILQWLVRLKDTKDKYGKTTEYLQDKEPAWSAAREALKQQP